MFLAVIGTQTHEWGHIAIARYLGYKTQLHYASMHPYNPRHLKPYSEELINRKSEISAETDTMKKALMREDLNKFVSSFVKKNRFKELLIVTGGPIQTMLTGTLGLILLLFRRKFWSTGVLKWLDWLGVFLSFFWLRQIFNLIIHFAKKLLRMSDSIILSDEIKIAKYMNWHPSSLSIITGIIALLIAVFVVFKVVPRGIRFSFVTGGILGGLSGFYLWFYILGPVLLP